MEKAIRILFADDDTVIRSLVEQTLSRVNMCVSLAVNGLNALEIWRQGAFDMVILDISMPELDGLNACKYIRSASDVPIIILTSRDTEEDVVNGFNAGADDYLAKPFRPRELIARIHAILNRVNKMEKVNEQLEFHNLLLNLSDQCLYKNGSNIHVTPLEFHLLHYFMMRPGRLVKKEELFSNVWGYNMPAGGMNLIEVAIRRLRTKIEDDPGQPFYIQSIRGHGYRMGD